MRQKARDGAGALVIDGAPRACERGARKELFGALNCRVYKGAARAWGGDVERAAAIGVCPPRKRGLVRVGHGRRPRDAPRGFGSRAVEYVVAKAHRVVDQAGAHVGRRKRTDWRRGEQTNGVEVAGQTRKSRRGAQVSLGNARLDCPRLVVVGHAGEDCGRSGQHNW